MLLLSTTYPLPAHNPWSAGSMSPRVVFVDSVALSTASSPFTPAAPPADALIESQPGPIVVEQVTAGGVGSTALRARAGSGSARGVEGKDADLAGELVAAEWLEAEGLS